MLLIKKKYVGIEWDEEGIGKNDGSAFGERYFESKPRKANFIPLREFKIKFKWEKKEEEHESHHNSIDIGI